MCLSGEGGSHVTVAVPSPVWGGDTHSQDREYAHLDRTGVTVPPDSTWGTSLAPYTGEGCHLRSGGLCFPNIIEVPLCLTTLNRRT